LECWIDEGDRGHAYKKDSYFLPYGHP